MTHISDADFSEIDRYESGTEGSEHFTSSGERRVLGS